MLRLEDDQASRFSRRRLLEIGALGAFGLNLVRLLESEASQPLQASKARSCILLFFYGGPSHIDTWDPKPQAPLEVRGEFKTISTKVPGLQVSEHLPRCAAVADKLAIIRSMHHPMRQHNSAAPTMLCGREPVRGDFDLLAPDRTVDFPSYGAALNHARPVDGVVPGHICLPHLMTNLVVLPGQDAGFLGPAYDPLQLTSDPSAPDFSGGELQLPGHLSTARLESRKSLLALVDAQRSRAATTVERHPLSIYQQKAFNLLGSRSVREAFDVGREPAQVRDRYGRHKLGQSMLLARRLVESGVRFVNVNDKVTNGQDTNWDSHKDCFIRHRDHLLPPADQALSALIEDLDVRGLLESTLVIALGEFGRSPLIDAHVAGRNHWPDCFSVVLAGGGVRGGTVYGASDKIGAHPETDGATPGDLAATIFWRFGLSRHRELHDALGRPFPLASGRPIEQLFGA